MEVVKVMQEILIFGIIFGLPLAAVIFFIVSLIQFLVTEKTDTTRRKKRKIQLIIATVIAGILVLGLVALVVLMALAMAHM